MYSITGTPFYIQSCYSYLHRYCLLYECCGLRHDARRSSNMARRCLIHVDSQVAQTVIDMAHIVQSL